MSGGYSLISEQGLLTAVASLVVGYGFWGVWASVVVHHSLWDPPRPGIEPTAATLVGELLTQELQGSPLSKQF